MTNIRITTNKDNQNDEIVHKEGNYYWTDEHGLLQLVYVSKAYLIIVKEGHWLAEGVDVGKCKNITQDEFDKLCGYSKGKVKHVDSVNIGVDF